MNAVISRVRRPREVFPNSSRHTDVSQQRSTSRPALISLLSVILATIALPPSTQALDIGRMSKEERTRYYAFKDALFVESQQRFAEEQRTVATLVACGQDEFVTSIESRAVGQMSALLDWISTARSQSGDVGEFARQLSAPDMFVVVESAKDQLHSYKLGYMDAIAALDRVAPKVCEAAESTAKRLLREKSGDD